MTRTSVVWRALAAGFAASLALLAGATIAPVFAEEPTPTPTTTSAVESPAPEVPASTDAVAPEPTADPVVPEESDGTAWDVVAAEGMTPMTTHEFVPGLELDEFPVEGDNARWVLLIHGGSWLEGSRDSMTPYAQRLQLAGFAAFSMDYRLAGQAVWPAQLDDVDAALEWIRSNAETLRIDPDRGVILGASAGGHLALAAGTGGAQVRGVIAVSPSASPYQAWKNSHRSTSKKAFKLADGATLMLGCSPVVDYGACWDRWYSASPRNAISLGDPPMLILQARKDAVVPASMTSSFCRGASKVHVGCVRVLYSGSAHGGSLMQTAWSRILTWVTAKTS